MNFGGITFNDCTPDLVVACGVTAILDVALHGTNGIVKSGGGIAVLQEIDNHNTGNTFTGNLTIDDGTIQLGSDEVIPDTNDVILNGGTLDINGMNETIANLTLTANSTLSFNSGDSTQQLDISGLTLGAFTLTIDGWDGWLGAPGTGGKLVSSTSYSNAQLANVYFSDLGVTGATWLASGEIVPAVPEPATWLGGGGLVVFAVAHFLRRRRKRKSG